MNILPQGSLTSPTGFTAAAVACGLKQSGNLDLALLVSERPCTAAGVFTRNQVAAAPVVVDRQTLPANRNRIRAVLTNAGCANACTGAVGLANARATQQLTAASVGCDADQVLVLSTGVIGVQLNMAKMAVGIQTAVSQLTADAGIMAARAIMTTDTRPKYLAVQVAVAGGVITIGGIAKGAGMIHPDMATLLALITTDAIIDAAVLSDLLATAVNQSFNRISVDGDTSTNDTVLLLANGAAGISLADPDSLAAFAEALNYLCLWLAHQIVRDGEGATKFVEIMVTGAVNEAAATAVGRTIATSPLVKTALAGSDPNWGRILAAAGRAGVPLAPERLSLWVEAEDAGLQLIERGLPTAYQEAKAAALFARPEFRLRLDLGQGTAVATIWTCDLGHEYVTINADYRT
jgi:glutamate N-acetyltransferase / amino-acid N-acetyltransferase